MSKPPASLAALAVAASSYPGGINMLLNLIQPKSKRPKSITAEDLQRLEAAKAKRELKNSKRKPSCI